MEFLKTVMNRGINNKFVHEVLGKLDFVSFEFTNEKLFKNLRRNSWCFVFEISKTKHKYLSSLENVAFFSVRKLVFVVYAQKKEQNIICYVLVLWLTGWFVIQK